MQLSSIPSSLATLDDVAPGQRVILRCLLCDEYGRTCAPCPLRPGATVRCRDVQSGTVRVETADGCVYEIPMHCASRIQIERIAVNAPSGAAPPETQPRDTALRGARR